MKNRTLIGILCIILAVATVFVVSPLINKSAEKKTTVVVVSHDIDKGGRITTDKLKTVDMPDNIIPAGAIKSIEAFSAQTAYASVDMKNGDVVTSAKITQEVNNIDNVLSSLSGEKVAMSKKISSFAGGLSGKLESGDIVSLSVTQNKVTTIPLEFRYVRVLTTTTSGGVDYDEVQKNDDGSFTQSASVTFLLTPWQAAYLDSIKDSAVTIALVYRGPEENAKKLLDEQDEYLNKLEKSSEELARRMMSGNANIVSSSAAFNEYYKEHKDEFLKLTSEIMNYIFGLNFDSDKSTIYEDAENPEGVTTNVTVEDDTTPVENPVVEENTNE